MAEVQIQSISHRHEAIADWLLAHPNEKNLEPLCAHIRVSRSWLSVVMRSDVFREYFAKRRRDWEQGMHEQIGAKQLQVLQQAWDRLGDILTDDGTDPRLVFDVADKTAARLFGKVGTGPTRRVEEQHTQEIVRSVDAGTLSNAREIFRRTVTTVKEVPLEQLPPPG